MIDNAQIKIGTTCSRKEINGEDNRCDKCEHKFTRRLVVKSEVYPLKETQFKGEVQFIVGEFNFKCCKSGTDASYPNCLVYKKVKDD